MGWFKYYNFARHSRSVPCMASPSRPSLWRSSAIHWLILFSVAEFPDQASITDLVENDTIKSLARSSIVYSASSSFAALSGNSDLHLHSPSQRAPEGSEDESESDEDEDEEKPREPIEHLLKVKLKWQSFLSIPWLFLSSCLAGRVVSMQILHYRRQLLYD